MIIGIGVDIVDVARFERLAERTPRILERTLTARELRDDDGSMRTFESLAARFAAKEAVAKALGAPSGLAWHDCEVVVASDGAPSLQVRATVAERARSLGIGTWHLSLSHDGGKAVAFVIASA